jgi:hypothetical protein
MILVKATKGVGTPRLLSGRKFPAPSINLQPTIPKSGFVFANVKIFQMYLLQQLYQDLRMQIYSPLLEQLQCYFLLENLNFLCFR